jgi:hypothetical protein
MYNVTVELVRANTVAVKNSQYYVFWVCVCKSVIQHAQHGQSGFIMSSHDLGGKVIEHEIYVLFSIKFVFCFP